MPLIEVIHSSTSSSSTTSTSTSSNNQNNEQSQQPDETTTTTKVPSIILPHTLIPQQPCVPSVHTTTREEEEEDANSRIVSIRIAREAIQSLVEHYQQPIHLIGVSSSVGDDNKNTDVDNPPPPPFVEHWLRRLQEHLDQQSSCNNHHHNKSNMMMMMVQSMVHSYVTTIRPTLLLMDEDDDCMESSSKLDASSVNPQGVPVLVHYELLLSKFLQRQEVEEQEAHAQQQQQQQAAATKGEQTTMAITFAETLQCMACDITRLTSFCVSITTFSNDNEPAASSSSSPSPSPSSISSSLSHLVPNIVLPTLVRLVQLIQSYILKYNSSFIVKGTTTTTTTTTADIHEIEQQHQRYFVDMNHDNDDDLLTIAMRRCDVSVLAFGMPCLGPLQIHAELSNRIDTNTVLQRYAVYPHSIHTTHSKEEKEDPIITTTLDNGGEQKNNNNNSYLSTSFVQSNNGQAWEQDPATRAALAYWKFKSSSTTFHSNDNANNTSNSSSLLLRDAQQRYFKMARRQGQELSCHSSNGQQELFLLSMARAVRAHFFGRDMKIVCGTTTTTSVVNYTIHHDNGNSSSTIITPTMAPRQEQNQQQRRLHLGHWTTVTKQSFLSKEVHATTHDAPFRAIPSRIHVACQFISLLTAEDDVFVAGSSKNGSKNNNNNSSIAEELLPIVMELLSAPVYAMQSWGAACLLHLLSLETTTTTPAPLHRRHDDANDDSIGTWNPVQMDNLLSLLQVNIQTCREGPVLAVLGMAQRELLRRSCFVDPALRNTDTKTRQSLVLRRKKATQEWLLMLCKNLHSYQHSSNNHLVWGVLVGGIVPLFYDHCTPDDDDDPNARLIELGRLGLLSLLPLIRNAYQSSSILEDEDDAAEEIDLDGGMAASLPSDNMNSENHKREQHDIELLALLALSNLMVAAHPIMPHHGGKIMCALLSACCSCTAVRDCQDSKNVATITADTDASPRGVVLFEWAYHVAAMSVVSCGKRAVDILDVVLQENDKKTHQCDHDCKNVVSLAAREIKRRADEMMTMITSATK